MKQTVIALSILLSTAAGFGQTPPAFEAASIKLNTSVDTGTHSHSTPGALNMQNQTLRSLVWSAYSVREYQVLGGPKWLDTDRYDINAKANKPAEEPELMLMLQTLLAERFKLLVHRESKPLPGYALVVARKGLKIKPVEGATGSSTKSANRILTAKGISMAHLADWLARQLGMPVLDDTHVSGVFDFTLQWSREDSSGVAPAGAPPLLPDALEEQLGVRLDPRKLRQDVIVVDSAEKAVEN